MHRGDHDLVVEVGGGERAAVDVHGVVVAVAVAAAVAVGAGGDVVEAAVDVAVDAAARAVEALGGEGGGGGGAADAAEAAASRAADRRSVLGKGSAQHYSLSKMEGRISSNYLLCAPDVHAVPPGGPVV